MFGFPALVRFGVAVFCAAFASLLIAASPPPAAFGGPPPVVVVFPFKTSDGLDPVNGREYAIALGAALTKAGGVKVIMADPATPTSEFLKVTAASGGDYYISGFVQEPVRGNTLVLEQIVSRKSGTAVWGNTAHIVNDSDIRDQGPIVHDALITYASRGYYTVLNATPAPAATKAPDKKQKNGISTSTANGGPQPGQTPRRTLDLPNEAYGYSSAATPQPKEYASATHPTRFAILPITGPTAPDVMKRYTEDSLVNTLSHHGQPALAADPEATKHYLMHPSDTCKQTGAQFLVFGLISTRSTDVTLGVDSWTDARYTPRVYDCAAGEYHLKINAVAASAFNWKTAIDRATLKAVNDVFSKLAQKNTRA